MCTEDCCVLQAGIDGDQSVVLWYQPYWDIVKQILADTNAAPHMTYGFVPEHDPVTKERRYGGFCSAMWMEAAMREALAKDPDVTVVAVLVGSDATSIKNRDGAHPAYASLGNLSLPYRRGDQGWVLSGFIPLLDVNCMDTAKKMDIKRRKRQLFNKAMYTMLESLIKIYEAGGEWVLCGDGITRKILPIVAMWITDRQEHETVLQILAHICFACYLPRRDWLNAKKCAGPQARAKSSQEIAEHTRTAMTTGVYGAQDEWQTQYTGAAAQRGEYNPKPIVTVDTVTGRAIINAKKRYLHCARVTGTFPDDNLLWKLPCVNLNQICRDDPLHQTVLGVMGHIFSAMMTAYTR